MITGLINLDKATTEIPECKETCEECGLSQHWKFKSMADDPYSYVYCYECYNEDVKEDSAYVCRGKFRIYVPFVDTDLEWD